MRLCKFDRKTDSVIWIIAVFDVLLFRSIKMPFARSFGSCYFLWKKSRIEREKDRMRKERRATILTSSSASSNVDCRLLFFFSLQTIPVAIYPFFLVSLREKVRNKMRTNKLTAERGSSIKETSLTNADLNAYLRRKWQQKPINFFLNHSKESLLFYRQ